MTLPTGATTTYRYNPLGALVHAEYGNGTFSDYVYDQADRLTSLQQNSADKSVIAWYNFVYDKVGNRVATNERLFIAPNVPTAEIQRTYSYDALYRLIGSTASLSQTYNVSWKFDPVGNRVGSSRTQLPTTMQGIDGAPSFALASTQDMSQTTTISSTYNVINALTSAGDWTYSYDDTGNRIRATIPMTRTHYAPLASQVGEHATLVLSYTYDADNHITSVSEALHHANGISPTMQATYTYDGMGRRIEKRVTTYTAWVSPPVARFAAQPVTGTLPLTVTFSDQSTGVITDRQWHFGDGSTSTVQTPTHVYAQAGWYTVSLTVNGPAGSDTFTHTNCISVTTPVPMPVANFTANPLNGTVPLTVSFIDRSTGTITNWLWRFGDGSTSTVQTPTHIYTQEGWYDVGLTISGPAGSNTLTHTNYISVTAPLPAVVDDPTQRVYLPFIIMECSKQVMSMSTIICTPAKSGMQKWEPTTFLPAITTPSRVYGSSKMCTVAA